MRRHVAAILLLGAALAGCSPPQGTRQSGPATLQPPPAQVQAACGGDRGIGGTGARQRAGDRGIGGTGISSTGIVAAVTGFGLKGSGSICVNGLAIALDGNALIEIDGAPAPPTALAVGQVVEVAADASLRATRVAVRHVVSGPVDAVADGSVTVAGQPVLLPPGAIDPQLIRRGRYVAVSGLRRADGVVVASRIDSHPAGRTMLTGLVERRGRDDFVGGAKLRGRHLPEGAVATVGGRYGRGVLVVASAAAEPMLPFGQPSDRVLMQAFVTADGDGLLLGHGLRVRRAENVAPPPVVGIFVVELAADENGNMVAVGMDSDRGRGSEGGATSTHAPEGGARAGPASGGRGGGSQSGGGSDRRD